MDGLRFVVDVREPYDPITGIGGTSHRFTYGTEAEAWRAYSRAIAAGFESRAERVLDHRALASRAVSPRNDHGEHPTDLF